MRQNSYFCVSITGMMENNHPYPPSRSIAARAADGGVVMGGLIMVLALGTGFTPVWPLASVFVWTGTIAVPFVLYFLLRRSYIQSGYSESIIELWAEGIAIFFFGSLVPALVVYLLLKYVQPDFIANQVNFSIQLLHEQGTAQAEALAESLTMILERGGLPSAAQVAAQLIAFNMFIGMFLSLLEAAMLALYYKNPVRRRPMENQIK